MKRSRTQQVSAVLAGVLVITAFAGCRPKLPEGYALVSGTVTYTTSQNSVVPMAGALVVAYEEGPRQLKVASFTSADRTGHYQFLDLPKGRYKVTSQQTWSPNVATFDDAAWVDTTSGDVVANISVPTRRNAMGPEPGSGLGAFHGVVEFGPSDAPDTWVAAVGPNRSLANVVQPAADGSFTIPNLAPGKYGLAVANEGDRFRDSWWDGRDAEAASFTYYEILPDQTTEMGTFEPVGRDCDPAIFYPGADYRNHRIQAFDLRRCDMSGVNLSGSSFLPDTDLRGAILTGANLDGARIQTGLTSGITSGGITGTPAELPGGLSFHNGYLVGPNLKLNNADLTGMPFSGDLSGADLRGANLQGISLDGVNLNGTLLDDANFTSASLRQATFDGARLPGTILTGAEIEHADFTGADLTGVISGGLRSNPLPLVAPWIYYDGYLVGPGAGMAGIDLSDVDLSNRNFRDCDLTGADLRRTNLAGADLTNVDLTGANLDSAMLRGATLDGIRSGSIIGRPLAPDGWVLHSEALVGPGADLTGANLTGLHIVGPLLTGTNLENANLSGVTFGNDEIGAPPSLANAVLDGANLNKVQLNGVDLTGIHSKNLTRLPTSLPPGWTSIAGAIFGPSANIIDATFFADSLNPIDLSGMNLDGINLSGSSFVGAVFANASMAGAQLTGTRFFGSDLNQVDLTDASLSQTIFQTTDLSDAKLVGASLDRVVFATPKVDDIDLTFASGTASIIPGTYPGDDEYYNGFGNWDHAHCPTAQMRPVPGEPRFRDLSIFDPDRENPILTVSAKTCFGEGLDWG